MARLVLYPIDVDGFRYERHMAIRQGYDCRGGCKGLCAHKLKSDYGIHGDEYHCFLGFEDAVLELRVWTPFLRGEESPLWPPPGTPRWYGNRLLLHTKRPSDSIRDRGDTCTLVAPSPCFIAYDEFTEAKELVEPLVESLERVRGARGARGVADVVFGAMIPIMRREYPLYSARADAVSRTMICPRCEGEGIVKR